MTRIEYLADYPQFIPTLAEWLTEAFAFLNPAGSVAQRITKLRQRAVRDQVPMTLVAVSDGRLVGSASLVEYDMDTHPELSPWLASVYVEPTCRGQGIGSKLVNRVEAEAKKLGIRRLYLFTLDRESFYRRLGWSTMKIEAYREHTVVMMDKVLEAA